MPEPEPIPYYRVTMPAAERFVMRLVRMQGLPLVGGVIRNFLRIVLKIDWPHWTLAGAEDLKMYHNGPIYIHSRVRIGKGVQIYHNVSVGRTDILEPLQPEFGIDLQDEVILGANSMVMHGGNSRLVVAEGTIVGANSLLRESTGPWEIWAGSPARKVGTRPRWAE